MRASICIATHDKPTYLRRVLQSIFCQAVMSSDQVEVIVVDDRSIDSDNRRVCGEFPVNYVRLEGEPGYRNPAPARNLAYRAARGEVIISQSDEVVHVSKNCVETLIASLTPGHFVIAHVFNADFDGNLIPTDLENPTYPPMICYTGPENPRPLFFLGSLYRCDLYAAGGNDEDFVAPAREDDWFARCLMRGLGLTPIFSTDVVGHHLQHRHSSTVANTAPAYAVYAEKVRRANAGEIPWQASGGPWPYP
jgi:glycosyltransferase involved in cell wall biosynthesis